MQNTLYTNDNLFTLCGMNSEIADLFYLDPPFNSKRIYSAPVGTKSAGASFKDMWGWEDVNEAYLDKIVENYPSLVDFIKSIQVSHSKAMMAYITYMTQRLIEMHRILKHTGSLYLHCDPTASHYLKMLLDFIFGRDNFRNEITWERSEQHNLAKKKFDTVTDIILYYTKSDDYYFQTQFSKLSLKEIEEKFPYTEEETGRRFMHRNLDKSSNRNYIGKRIIQGREIESLLGWIWTQETFDERLAENPYLIYWTKNDKPRYKIYADEYLGRQNTNLWDDIKGLGSMSKERTGYPTQKPLSLLKRIIEASSKEGDLVIDPFCGCATTCVAAQQLNRKWIGIDIEEKAAEVLIDRLSDDAGLFKDFAYINVLKNPKLNPQRTDLLIESITDESVKERLFAQQKGCCNGCNISLDIWHFEVDHIVPKAKGGGDYYENFQLLCGNCNRIKGAKPMEYLRLKIRTRQELMRGQVEFGE